MYSHDSPPQQPEVPKYDAPFLPGANAAPSPMAPPPVAPFPGEKKTTRSGLKPPLLPEVPKTKTPPTPRTSQRALSPRKKRRGVSLWFKVVLTLAAILILAIGVFASYGVYSFFNHPARAVIQKFYMAMEQKNYKKAYSFVNKNVLRDRFLAISFDDSSIYYNVGDFTSACKAIDNQKGKIASFSVTSFSTFHPFALDDSVIADINITRGGQSYTAHMGLVQEGKSWKIDYVDNL